MWVNTKVEKQRLRCSDSDQGYVNVLYAIVKAAIVVQVYDWINITFPCWLINVSIYSNILVHRETYSV